MTAARKTRVEIKLILQIAGMHFRSIFVIARLELTMMVRTVNKVGYNKRAIVDPSVKEWAT